MTIPCVSHKNIRYDEKQNRSNAAHQIRTPCLSDFVPVDYISKSAKIMLIFNRISKSWSE